MAFILTMREPWSDPDSNTAGTSVSARYAVLSLGEVRDIVKGIFSGYGEDHITIEQPRDDGVGSLYTLPNGNTITVEYWGAAHAVNWMVANGYDPATQDFIPTFNTNN